MGPWQHHRHEIAWIFIQITEWHQREAPRACPLQTFDIRVDSHVKTLPCFDRKLIHPFFPLKRLSSFGVGCSVHIWAYNGWTCEQYTSKQDEKSINNIKTRRILNCYCIYNSFFLNALKTLLSYKMLIIQFFKYFLRNQRINYVNYRTFITHLQFI